MATVNWGAFEELSGAATDNFEGLCRALIKQHYGQFGRFAALSNQPGVEFHLYLEQSCSLGKASRWWGWQCRWYGIRSGTAIGKRRKDKITKAIETTEKHLPELTDWVLWTRHPLTESDQKWFYGLPTSMKLHLLTSKDVEDYLSGPATHFRATYFDELILSSDELNKQHGRAVASVRHRWIPEVHQTINAERELNYHIGKPNSWIELKEIAISLKNAVTNVVSETQDLPETLARQIDATITVANAFETKTSTVYEILCAGDFEMLHLELGKPCTKPDERKSLLRQLRRERHPSILLVTNLIADIHSAYDELNQLQECVQTGLIAIVADAGCGKTQLAAQFTSANDKRPAGILLHGSSLASSGSLDTLVVSSITLHGKPVPSFESLIAAVDAAGRRAKCRLPIFIDGLNESEDPRIWKRLFAPLDQLMISYPYVLVVCTLRPPFRDESLPAGTLCYEIPDFDYDTANAIRRYFQHYRINSVDAMLPFNLLRHPLTLRIFCEVTNPDRVRTVGLEAMPGSLTTLFDRYLDDIAKRVAELSSPHQRYFPADVLDAINKIGLTLWEDQGRNIEQKKLRQLLNDETRPWDKSLVRSLEQNGILIRTPMQDRVSNGYAISYDALAGHIVADALIKQLQVQGRTLSDWLTNKQTQTALSDKVGEGFTLGSDTFEALVGIAPRRLHRQQLWPLLEGVLQVNALHLTAKLEPTYLNSETVHKLAELTRQKPVHIGRRHDVLHRLWELRAAHHPLNAEFLDSVLRPMTMADRDLRWSEWIRHNQKGYRGENDAMADVLRWKEKWRTETTVSNEDVLRARWFMWLLTTTVRDLRDHTTHALYWYGNREPQSLFELTLDSLSINDPYVPERMLSACYGVAMGLWAHPDGESLRETIFPFADNLIEQMFVSNAPYSTWHTLTRDYALGIITLARKIDSTWIATEHMRYLTPPFDHVPTPFVDPNKIDDAEVSGATVAIRMDFGNYTIGRLIKGRSNYNDTHPRYQEVLKQIKFRMLELGYSPDLFRDADDNIERSHGYSRHPGGEKTDRYGKKYSWIAYFEMYGIHEARNLLDEWKQGERPSDG